MLHCNILESDDDDVDNAKRRIIYPRPRSANLLRTRTNTSDVTSVSGLHSFLR